MIGQFFRPYSTVRPTKFKCMPLREIINIPYNEIQILVFPTIHGPCTLSLGHKSVGKTQCVFYIIICLCLARTGNYQIQEFDWLKLILTGV